MRAGIRGEYENLPSPIPIRSVAPPAIDSLSHAEDGERVLEDIDTLETLNQLVAPVQRGVGFCECAIPVMLTHTATIF
jgi:hypothetical protein